MGVGKRIVALRTEKGLEQQDLAELSGVSQSQLSAIENEVTKSPRLVTLEKLAKALGVPVSALTNEAPPLGQGFDDLAWFWRKRFAFFRPSDIWRFRNAPVEERVAWAVRSLLDAFEPAEIAARSGQPEEHLTKLAASEAPVMPAMLDVLVERLQVPHNWLMNGAPVEPDLVIRKVLEHRDGAAYLAVINKAIDERVLPESLLDLLNAALAFKMGTEKPPTN